MFTDTHCHFEPQYYDNYEEIINKSLKNGVNRLIVSGCSIIGNTESLNLSKNYDNIFSTIGYHPDQAEKFDDEMLKLLEDMIINNKEKVVGIGEIGLDYHYEGYDKEKQHMLFKAQLDLATKLNLPVVIHSRDAVEDTINILKQYNLKGVIHSFSGSYETATIYLKMGYKLGINGVVTFKNSKLKETLSKLTPNDLVLETDSPYLTPEPYRGQKNDSSNIPIIADFISNIYNISLEDLSEITNNNIKSVFDI